MLVTPESTNGAVIRTEGSYAIGKWGVVTLSVDMRLELTISSPIDFRTHPDADSAAGETGGGGGGGR